MVCVAPDHFRGRRRAAPSGAPCSGHPARRPRGFFHPDNFTFGQPLYLSQLYAAVERRRRGSIGRGRACSSASASAAGRRAAAEAVIDVGRLEVLRLRQRPELPRERRAAHRACGAASDPVPTAYRLRLLRRRRRRPHRGLQPPRAGGGRLPDRHFAAFRRAAMARPSRRLAGSGRLTRLDRARRATTTASP